MISREDWPAKSETEIILLDDQSNQDTYLQNSQSEMQVSGLKLKFSAAKRFLCGLHSIDFIKINNSTKTTLSTCSSLTQVN